MEKLTIDHISTDRIWHSGILDIRLFRPADFHTDHCFVVATFRERLALSKQRKLCFIYRGVISGN
jgi:hypothetical protein